MAGEQGVGYLGGAVIQSGTSASQLRAAFAGRFSGEPLLVRAPARVNLIGEHTDYNDGLVLPTTTALFTSIAAAPRPDRRVQVFSEYSGETQTLDIDAAGDADTWRGSWFGYIAGVVRELLDEGVMLRGANLHIASDIPIGGGLSSSASLEMAVAVALLEISGSQLDRLHIARVGQRAESETVGLKCGIMDQYAIACCPYASAILIDCGTLDAKPVALPAGVSMIVVDSGVKHRLPEGDYNDRRAECDRALEILRERVSGLRSLCDVDQAELMASRAALGEVLYRRASHVVSENFRVAESVAAIMQGNVELLGAKIDESHASLRDDFEVSCEESDALVGMLRALAAVRGARQIGAGFGGCVLALVDATEVSDVVSRISREWGDAIASVPWVHVVEAAQPVGRFDDVASRKLAGSRS